MTAKEFLMRGRRIDESIRSREEELKQLRQRAGSITPNYNAAAVAGGEVHSRTEDIVIKICALEDTIKGEIAALVAVQSEIREAIERVPSPTDRLLLRERYIKFRTWEDIAEIMGYSVRHTIRVHGRVLQRFAQTNSLGGVSK